MNRAHIPKAMAKLGKGLVACRAPSIAPVETRQVKIKKRKVLIIIF